MMGCMTCSHKYCEGDKEEDEMGDACSMKREETILKMCP
jgi:hypothetical protein